MGGMPKAWEVASVKMMYRYREALRIEQSDLGQ